MTMAELNLIALSAGSAVVLAVLGFAVCVRFADWCAAREVARDREQERLWRESRRS